MDIKFSDGNVIVSGKSFDLRQTLDCGQAFRFSATGNIWRGIVNGRQIKLMQEGDTVTIFDMDKGEFDRYFYNYFTLDIDYDALKLKFSADVHLKAATEMSPGLRLLRQEKFETICSFIFSQNNNIPRIKGIIERFCENFGEETYGGYTFPKADKIAALTTEDLAPIRAGFRAKYIIDAAKRIAGGEVPLDALDTIPIQEARKLLCRIKGIGPKVAECILLFSCGRTEAFPVDVWIDRVMKNLYPGGLPECAKGAEGIAQQYLFEYARRGGDMLRNY